MKDCILVSCGMDGVLKIPNGIETYMRQKSPIFLCSAVGDFKITICAGAERRNGGCIMNIQRYLALILAGLFVLTSNILPVFSAEYGIISPDPDGFGTVTENADGSKTLNFGINSITVKGNRGDIVTDTDHDGVLRPDNLRTNEEYLAVLTLPSVNLKGTDFDKLELYVASMKNAKVSVIVGETEVALFDNINTGSWEDYKVFTENLKTTEVEGNLSLNITGEGANTYCGNYIYAKLYNSQTPPPTPKPTRDPSTLPTPLPTEDPEVPLYLDTTRSFEERTADLISRMTLEEKATQLTDEAAAIPRLKVASYNYWSEALHGVARQGKATSFPSPLSMSNTWNRALVNQMATITST